MKTTETFEGVQHDIIDAVAQSRSLVVEANRAVADLVHRAIPTSARQRLSDSAPGATTLIGAAFDLPGRLIAENRQFAEDLVAAWLEPTENGDTGPAVSPEDAAENGTI